MSLPLFLAKIVLFLQILNTIPIFKNKIYNSEQAPGLNP